MPSVDDISAALARHDRVAFQLSGGKDSVAALMLMRPYWDVLKVYWLNTGDMFPETEAYIRGMIDRFCLAGVEVQGFVNEAIHEFGIPSDIIPFHSSDVDRYMGFATQVLQQHRMLCCARGKMIPMHNRMIEDGITLIVRGQKDADDYGGPIRSGQVVDGFELLFPVKNWTDSDVFEFLASIDEIPPLYEHGITRSGDCMRCSAFLGDRRAEYLAKRHPEAFAEYSWRIAAICASASPVVNSVYGEMRLCDQAKQTEVNHG